MEKVIERFKKLDTTSVSDAMDKLGIPCGLYGLKAVNPGHHICGQAFTVHYVPCGQNKGTVGDFLDDVKPGQVVVIDNAGRDYCTVWGDIMCITAKSMGVEATIIDGVCRDLPTLHETQYPIYTKGYYMVTGKDRVEVDAVNVPVAISGVQVCPGDIILGDDTGVVVIPLARAEEIADIAEEIERVEQLIVAEVKNGSTLKDARKKLHYHSLQTKQA